MKKSLIHILATLFILVSNLFAQDLINTEGNDFWITFLPNYHNDNRINRSDSLYIFISANKPTKGEIIYRNRNGNLSTHQFSIVDPSIVYKFVTTFFDYELIGFNNSGTFDENKNQNEAIAKQFFRVKTDENVTVYALNQANFTSEAFLVLPSNVLGNDYYVLTYNSDGRDDLFGRISTESTPSQFAVLAVEDSTEVIISPSAPTAKNGLIQQKVLLNAGETYLVQARISLNDYYRDLTGSFIKSTKPVAVFAGHQRSTIPVGQFSQSSRDHLCEQMIPVRAWGKNAIVIPFAEPSRVTPVGQDLLRILAANDNTNVIIDNSSTILNAGKFIELPLIQPTYIEADKPIMVAQYKKTSRNQTNVTNISDPLMLIIPPVEQYITSYRVINAQATGINDQTNQSFKAYEEQYLGIIADRASFVNGIFINGAPINSSLFRQIPGRDYYWANVRVADGIHNLTSLGKFAVFVYGYGRANSYGYLGGMGMAIIDVMPPEIVTNIDCFKIFGSATDSNLTDTKIKKVFSTFQDNVALQIDRITNLAPTVNFKAELLNKYIDGQFNIVAEDALGQTTEKLIEIPGFTVGLSDTYTDEIPTIEHYFVTNSVNCTQLDLYNYGKFDTKINKIYFKNNSFEFKTELNSITIQAKNILKIEFCKNITNDTVIVDTLIIENDCINRSICIIKATFIIDTSAPEILLLSDNCNRDFVFNFLENRIFDSGIKEVKIETQINCDINYDVSDKKIAKLFISVINQREDAYFKIIVTDNNNQPAILEKFIPGFTLSGFYIETNNTFFFDTTEIGDFVCKGIEFYNYGNSELTLSEFFMFNNIYFSIPPSQRPLKIKPKESKLINICFNPLKTNLIYQDTLILDYNCIITKIPVAGLSKKQNFFLNSKCDVEISFSTSNSPNRVKIYPNPVSNEGIIFIPSSKYSDLKSVELYNLLSEKVMTFFETNGLTNDIYLKFDISEINDGLYFILLQTSKNIETYPIIISK